MQAVGSSPGRVKFKDLGREFISWVKEDRSIHYWNILAMPFERIGDHIDWLSGGHKGQFLEIFICSATNTGKATSFAIGDLRADTAYRRANREIFSRTLNHLAQSYAYVASFGVAQNLRLYKSVTELLRDCGQIQPGLSQEDLRNLNIVRMRILAAADLPVTREISSRDMGELRKALEQAEVKNLSRAFTDDRTVEIDNLDGFCEPNLAELKAVCAEIERDKEVRDSDFSQRDVDSFMDREEVLAAQRDSATAAHELIQDLEGPRGVARIFREERSVGPNGQIRLGEVRVSNSRRPIWRRIRGASLSPRAREALGDIDQGVDYMVKFSPGLRGLQYDFPDQKILGCVDEKVIHSAKGTYTIAKYIPGLRALGEDFVFASRANRQIEIAILWIAMAFLINLHAKHGLAHRDLKPENIFFVQDPSGRITRVMIGDMSSLCPASWTEQNKSFCDHKGLFFGTPDHHRSSYLPRCDGEVVQAYQYDHFAMILSILCLASAGKVPPVRLQAPYLTGFLQRRVDGFLVNESIQDQISDYLQDPSLAIDGYQSIFQALGREYEPEIRDIIRGLENKEERTYLEAELAKILQA